MDLGIDSICPGRKNEIALSQTVNLVGPNQDLDLSPGQMDVRVVPLFLGHFPHTDSESHRRAEVIEFKLTLKMMTSDHFPPGIQLIAEGIEFGSRKGRDTPTTRNTVALRQVIHDQLRIGTQMPSGQLSLTASARSPL